MTLPDGQARDLMVNYQLNPEFKAPVGTGDIIGTIQWSLDDTVTVEQPMIVL